MDLFLFVDATSKMPNSPKNLLAKYYYLPLHSLREGLKLTHTED